MRFHRSPFFWLVLIVGAVWIAGELRLYAERNAAVVIPRDEQLIQDAAHWFHMRAATRPTTQEGGGH